MKQFILFSLGGIFYIIIELLWRGSSHWTMFFLGGLCFLLIGLMNEFFTFEIPLLPEMLIGAFLITLLEFITGYIVNIKLGMNVWDYSYLRFNIMGQVSLFYSVLWFILSGVCIIVDDWLRYILFGEEKPHYKLV
ncbi:MAG: hypothetical protein PUF72_04800 [Clostridiales bacterium]|nr:hypothetical protein [Clostridiales bacterium]